jgi:hypothetical protein
MYHHLILFTILGHISAFFLPGGVTHVVQKFGRIGRFGTAQCLAMVVYTGGGNLTSPCGERRPVSFGIWVLDLLGASAHDAFCNGFSESLSLVVIGTQHWRGSRLTPSGSGQILHFSPSDFRLGAGAGGFLGLRFACCILERSCHGILFSLLPVLSLSPSCIRGICWLIYSVP